MRKILFLVMLVMGCYVFWDLFVRDNPPLPNIEGSNFMRMVKGVIELIIGVVCTLVAFILWDIEEELGR